MTNFNRGDVVIVDLGYLGKTRPCVALSGPRADSERNISIVVPLTTQIHGGKCEIAFDKPPWLRETSVVNVLGIVGIENVKIIRKIAPFPKAKLAEIYSRLHGALGGEHELPWSAPELAVPGVLEVTDPSDPVQIADFIVTKLIERAPSRLEVEWKVDTAIWILKTQAGISEEIFRHSDIGSFRSVLARFGANFMEMQLYGGHMQRTLRQGPNICVTDAFMSNLGRAGFWIRIYATPNPTS